jgi:hypothetical protein
MQSHFPRIEQKLLWRVVVPPAEQEWRYAAQTHEVGREEKSMAETRAKELV